MQILALIILFYAAKSAWDDARKAWRTSRSAYMRGVDARFPGAPRGRRAAYALRHDAGYWAGQAARAFPRARHGFAAGWHAGRTAQYEGRAAREEAKTAHLEARAGLAEQVAGWHARQQEALRRLREAEQRTREQYGREGRQGREGSAPEVGDPPPAAPAREPARRVCVACGNPEYGPRRDGGNWGPLVTYREPVYDDGYPEEPRLIHEQHFHDESTGFYGRPYDGARDCCLCGLPLPSSVTSDAHPRCEEVYEQDNAACEIGDNRDLDEVEADLRAQGKCPWQLRPAGWGDCGLYCGRPVTDTGGDTPDLFCLQHAAEAAGDDEGAAQELNEHVQELLRQNARQEPETVTTQGEPAMLGTTSDITYDGVIAAMSAATARAEGTAADQQQSSTQASAMSEQMQALGVDPATLSAMADHLDAHDAAVKAQQRVQETAEAVEAALKRGHSGLAEAHQSAPVQAATREFYAG